MKVDSRCWRRCGKATAFTLVEMLVATAVGSIILAAVASLSLYGSRTIVAMGNYVDLDDKSRNAVDIISREVRGSSGVASYNSSLPVRSLTFTNNAAVAVTLTFDSNAHTLVLTKTGQTPKTLLTQCDQWIFSLYNKVPQINSSNILFYPATNAADCKLINMSWKCSRQILGAKVNTENVQTAQIVLRNKVN